MTAALRLYRVAAGGLGALVARAVLQYRSRRGREDRARIAERFGVASCARPSGGVVWMHAASVGESLSLLPLIDVFRLRRPDLSLVVTTGTKTSAEMMATRLPPGAIHQFVPVDTRRAVRRFLDHWRPSLLVIAESELWPTMLTETAARGTPIALVSARLSAKSARNWARAPRTAAALLDTFSAILAQNDAVAARFLDLGASLERVTPLGSLKAGSPPLPDRPAERRAIAAALGDRPLWLAASTHPGEETAAIAAHRALLRRAPDALLLIAPRHPERAPEIVAEATEAGLRAALRSAEPTPPPGAEVFVVDALGELGLWYRLAPIAFVGGSLAPIGGHNPMEPARLDTAILIGPHIEAFAAECAHLQEADGLEIVDAPRALAQRIVEYVALDPARASALAENAAAAAIEADIEGAAIVEAAFKRLYALLPQRDLGAEAVNDAAA